MIENALTGESQACPDSGPQERVDFNAEPWASARRFASHAFELPPLPVLALAGDTADVSIADWDALLCAIKARLRLTVAPLLAQHLNGSAAPLQASVLECVDALDQLHITMKHELGRVPPAARQEGGNRRDASLTRAAMGQWLDGVLAAAGVGGPDLALIYVGLDGIEAVQDTHGPALLDELHKAVAARLLLRSSRNPDRVCHTGGSEFACVPTEEFDRQQLGAMARSLFDLVSAPLTIGATEFRLRASVGVATCPGDGTSAATLLQNAESAMLRARRQQTGHAFCDPRKQSR